MYLGGSKCLRFINNVNKLAEANHVTQYQKNN